MKNQQRWTEFWRPFVTATVMAAGTSQAATITVNSLLDDVFPDASGAIFDVSGAPVTLAASKCTLRMAIASANLDLAVGGANGCVAGDSETLITSPPRGVADVIRFSSAVTGTIDVNVTKKMSEAPAVFRDLTSGAPAPNTKSALVVTRPLVIQGNTASGVPTVTLDGGLLANSAADAGQAVARETLMADVWDTNWFGSTKTLDFHISSLRRKIDIPARVSRLTTLRGIGYRYELP